VAGNSVPYTGDSPPIFRHYSGKVPVRRTASAGARASGRACKYGPRDADGYCPKRPSSGRSSGGGRPCKYGPRGADGYCPKRPSSGRSSGTTGTAPAATPRRRETAAQRERRIDQAAQAGTELVGVAAQLAIPRIPAARRLFNSPVTRAGAGALTLGGVAGLAVAAGLASYGATSYVLSRIRNARERKAKEQSLAATAYRVARADMERRLGRGMTRPEHDLLAAAWRDQLPQAR